MEYVICQCPPSKQKPTKIEMDENEIIVDTAITCSRCGHYIKPWKHVALQPTESPLPDVRNGA